jgi:hypothetical protein
MPTKKANQFAEVVETTEEETPAVEVQPLVVNSDTIQARVKGTWTMFWGQQVFNFEDGNRYTIPRDLYNYLKNSGNIYDTL